MATVFIRIGFLYANPIAATRSLIAEACVEALRQGGKRNAATI